MTVEIGLSCIRNKNRSLNVFSSFFFWDFGDLAGLRFGVHYSARRLWQGLDSLSPGYDILPVAFLPSPLLSAVVLESGYWCLGRR
jgi:hypothetical protein